MRLLVRPQIKLEHQQTGWTRGCPEAGAYCSVSCQSLEMEPSPVPVLLASLLTVEALAPLLGLPAPEFSGPFTPWLEVPLNHSHSRLNDVITGVQDHINGTTVFR